MDGQDQHSDYYQQQHEAPNQPYYASSSSSTQQHPGFVPIYTQHHTQPAYTAYPASSSASPQNPYATSEGDPDADLKRLRNTAASARFRAKKKQREQTLEQQAREKKQALEKLENRIRELEQENRFLKGLIMGPREEELKVCRGLSAGPETWIALCFAV